MVDTGKGLQTFAFKSFQNLAGDCTRNIVYSPFSSFVCTAMTAFISKDNTKKQIMQALGISDNDADAQQVAEQLLAILERTYMSGNNFTITGSNDIWPNANIEINLDEFRILRDVLQLSITPQTFPQPGCDFINHFIEEKTKGLIKNLLSPGDVDEVSYLLTNCVYFKADWQTQFGQEATRDGQFNGFNGPTPTKLMFKEANYSYAKVDDVQLLEIPYQGIPFSMVFMLPQDGTPEALQSLVSRLNETTFAAMCSQLRMLHGTVTIPKFKIEWGAQSLKQMLQTLGATDMFDRSKAKLPANSFVSDVIQKAVIIVDEKGTEAAAATAMMMMMCAFFENEFDFKADHPFVYVLRNTQTGDVLFNGICATPTAP